ncbi:rCG31157 [Rattus norvegicus]|uniref:RCG31157 n=1 Tax=Rattus norvegicus TaxID=10116 RepID=A6ISW6_RAT|nr:rCG31157 [Rattus norvegicus]
MSDSPVPSSTVTGLQGVLPPLDFYKP